MLKRELILLLEEVFADGFASVATYNDIPITSVESEYEGNLHYYEAKLASILLKYEEQE